MIEYYECKKCGWGGEEDELVDDTDDGKFNQCPRCHGTDFEIEEQDE